MPSLANRELVPNMVVEARNLVIASAPGAALSRERLADVVRAPSCSPAEEPSAGGGETEPDARPSGLGDAVTVPVRDNTQCVNNCVRSRHY